MSPEQPHLETAAGRGPWKYPGLLVAIVTLISAAFIVSGYWLFARGPEDRVAERPQGDVISSPTAEPAVPSSSDVLQFSGTGDSMTDTFEVQEGWEIHWENAGDRFALTITGDRELGTLVQQEEPGSGVTYPVGGGAFRLEITAEGPWAVRIIHPR